MLFNCRLYRQNERKDCHQGDFMSRPLTIACVQNTPKMADVDANLEQINELTREAARKGAEFVVFSELALTGYNQDILGENISKLACTTEDEPICKLAQIARAHHVTLTVGFLERRTIPGIVYNSIVIIDNDGAILDTYAKTHLFFKEHVNFREGPVLKVIKTRYGIIGPMICMDGGYPEVARILCLQGAEVLINPSAWIQEDGDLWALMLQSRALDNLAFVVGVNHAGAEGDIHYIGQSMVVEPRGHIINRLDAEEGILITTIDLDEVITARHRAPRLMLRRPELYGKLSDAY
jgi:predicted amidohydrolase